MSNAAGLVGAQGPLDTHLAAALGMERLLETPQGVQARHPPSSPVPPNPIPLLSSEFTQAAARELWASRAGGLGSSPTSGPLGPLRLTAPASTPLPVPWPRPQRGRTSTEARMPERSHPDPAGHQERSGREGPPRARGPLPPLQGSQPPRPLPQHEDRPGRWRGGGRGDPDSQGCVQAGLAAVLAHPGSSEKWGLEPKRDGRTSGAGRPQFSSEIGVILYYYDFFVVNLVS